MNKEKLREELYQEGFLNIYEWQDKPHTEYQNHIHKGKVSLYLLAGEVSFNFKDEIVDLKIGERLDVPPGKEHSAKVGPNGASYLVGEMIAGDS